MATKVVDTSAVCALVFAEPKGPRIATLLDGHQLVAPPLLEYEFANVCVSKLKKFMATHKREGSPLRSSVVRNHINVAWALFDQLDIEFVRVSATAATTLAIEFELTSYDAAYLWLATELRVDLVTLDSKLQVAATKVLR